MNRGEGFAISIRGQIFDDKRRGRGGGSVGDEWRRRRDGQLLQIEWTGGSGESDENTKYDERFGHDTAQLNG